MKFGLDLTVVSNCGRLGPRDDGVKQAEKHRLFPLGDSLDLICLQAVSFFVWASEYDSILHTPDRATVAAVFGRHAGHQ